MGKNFSSVLEILTSSIQPDGFCIADLLTFSPMAQQQQGHTGSRIAASLSYMHCLQVVDHYQDLSASFQEFSPEEDMEPAAPKEE